MKANRKPKVSLGIPVYNGERFVGEAIQSALDQTFKDFELIICDNASTDRTPEICQEFARKDSRIRYFRQEINIGSKGNFNRVFEYSTGEFFKWMAADDVCGPRYLELTMAALGQDPTAVLAHTLSAMINSKGELITHEEVNAGVVFDEGFPVRIQPTDGPRRFDADSAHERFQAILLDTFWCFEIFALIRREALLRTYPKRAYYGSDKVMLAQLSLIGRFVQVPEVQFYRRAHKGNSTNLTNKAREIWSHGVRTRWNVPSQVPCLKGYAVSALTLPLSFIERMRCFGVIGRYLVRPNRYVSMVRQILNLGSRRQGAILSLEKMPLNERMPRG